jgi:creatinine amidohydrolase/Fe(II)-dependent formamide hydrolase-like protein
MDKLRRSLATIVLLLIAAFGCAGSAAAQRPDSVFLEDLTWTEVQASVAAGQTTIIIPVGGVEQSGPYMALGKHDVRVRVLSETIARNLGNALVAPVVSYVPEGNLDPPTEHMRFPGTISIPAAAFRETLKSAARSFQLHGFRDVVLIGDHGGYQADLKQVADELNRAWANTPARAHYIAAYYSATQVAYVAALRARGYAAAEIGSHAGLADTSLSLAVDPRLVRSARLRGAAQPGPAQGVFGDPRRATAALGQLGVSEIVREATLAIQADIQSSRATPSVTPARKR